MESRFSCDTQMSPHRSVLSEHLVWFFLFPRWNNDTRTRSWSWTWSRLTYDDGAGAQQPDLLLQRHPVGDFVLRAVRPRAVLSVHVLLPGSAPSSQSSQSQSSPHSVFMRTERAALAQQPATVRGRMLNTRDSARCVQGRVGSSLRGKVRGFFLPISSVQVKNKGL